MASMVNEFSRFELASMKACKIRISAANAHAGYYLSVTFLPFQTRK